MKYNKIFFRTLFCLSATVALASCDNDDLIVGGADTGVIPRFCELPNILCIGLFSVANSLRSHTKF